VDAHARHQLVRQGNVENSVGLAAEAEAEVALEAVELVEDVVVEELPELGALARLVQQREQRLEAPDG
jgi:hypothetical protein